MKPVSIALLISVWAITGASAQTLDAFGRQPSPRTVIVIDESGSEVRGRLIGMTAEDLTIATDEGRDRTFLRSRVAAVYRLGDPLKNGAVIGLVIGAGWGLLARPELGCWNVQSTQHRQCTAKEEAGFAAINAVMGGVIGAGIGALVDKLTPGRRLVYERPKTPATTSVRPVITRSGVGLSMGLSW